MFLAPVLYLIHAVLTGVSMALMNLLHVKLGFTFSAGAFDYIISYRLATNGWMLIPVGLVYFLIYYFLFSFAIRKFNLATPGRADAGAEKADETAPAVEPVGAASGAIGYIRALGGTRNIKLVDACTTRLRLELADDSLVSEPALRTLGARGIVRPAQNVMQVVIGPQAEIVAGEIRDALKGEEYAGMTAAEGKPLAAVETAKIASISEGRSAEVDSDLADRLLDALGGIANVQKAEHAAVTRLRFVLRVGGKADNEALKRSGAAGFVRMSDSVWHVIAGHQAAAVAAAVGAKLDHR
jgi:PTS system N-acetylglucosamine-specific IIC component